MEYFRVSNISVPSTRTNNSFSHTHTKKHLTGHFGSFDEIDGGIVARRSTVSVFEQVDVGPGASPYGPEHILSCHLADEMQQGSAIALYHRVRR